MEDWTMTDSKREKRVLDFLVREACRRLQVKKVILYGSRARGTAHPHSDFDIAVIPGDVPESEWNRFVLDLEENLETLLPIDCVRLDAVDDDLRASVLREGKVLYAV